MKQIERHQGIRGWLERWQHKSNTCNCTMTSRLPAAAGSHAELPVVYWLSGLTCTDDNVRVKPGRSATAPNWG